MPAKPQHAKGWPVSFHRRFVHLCKFLANFCHDNFDFFHTTGFVLIEFECFIHRSIALWMLYQMFFGTDSIGWSVRAQIARKVQNGRKMALDSGRFCDSAAERFTRSSPTQKKSCRTHQDLSIGVKQVWIHSKWRASENKNEIVVTNRMKPNYWKQHPVSDDDHQLKHCKTVGHGLKIKRNSMKNEPSFTCAVSSCPAVWTSCRTLRTCRWRHRDDCARGSSDCRPMDTTGSPGNWIEWKI